MAIIRVNSNDYESGEVYLSKLSAEVEKEFIILRSLLSSYWKSKVDGPIYARNLKAVAISLSQIKLALDEIFSDNQYSITRTEFIYQVVTNLVFPFESPDLGTNDDDFRSFLQQVILFYFKGSVPSSIEEGIKLLTSSDVKIIEAYEAARKKGSGYDISDQFTFAIDVILTDRNQYNTMMLDRNIRILMSVLRPAHTLYKTKYILKDEYLGQSKPPITGTPARPHKVIDSYFADVSSKTYEDFRKFILGVKDIDVDGFKTSVRVNNESVTI